MLDENIMPVIDDVVTPLDTFTTGTGRKLKTDYFVFSENPPFAFIRILGPDIIECTKIFSDPKETAELTYGNQVLRGYTNLCSAANEKPAVKIQLSR